MIALLQRTGFRVEELFQALVFFVIFLLPVARGILASRRKRAEVETARRSGRSTTEALDEPDATDVPSGEPAEGRQLWEQLLRGELPQAGTEAREARRAPAPVPAPPRPRKRPAPRPAEPVHEPVFGGLEDIVLENQLERRGSTTVATDGLTSHAGRASPRGSDPSGRRVASLATDPAPPLASDVSRIAAMPAVDLSVSTSDPYGSTRADLRDAATARSVRALRQAVVWTEILGPPVSLRGPGTGPAGPPGLADR